MRGDAGHVAAWVILALMLAGGSLAAWAAWSLIARVVAWLTG